MNLSKFVARFIALFISFVQAGFSFPQVNETFAKRAVKPKLGISEAAAYLGKYGYLSKTKAKSAELGGLVDLNSYKDSIKRLQVMLNLPPTGKLDDKTLIEMAKPRCGVEDTVGQMQKFSKGHHAKSQFKNKKSRRKSRKKDKKGKKDKKKDGKKDGKKGEAKSRVKRYNLVEGGPWRKNELTYKINNYTPDMSSSKVDSSIKDALQMWSDKSGLTFRKAKKGEKANINVRFGSGNHGDYYPFDGKGGTLAHAFFPENGESHFDEAEDFDFKDGSGVNLMIVAAHEFGHALGLAHSNVPNSLMAPVYQGYVPNYKLHKDDVAAIQRLYGKNPNPATTEATTTTTERPRRTTTTERPRRTTTTERNPTKPDDRAIDICRGDFTFDATFFDHEKQAMFAFKGKYFWRFDEQGRFDNYPQLSSRRWRGIPQRIDAAAYSRVTGRTYFFSGDKIYRYGGYNLDGGFPRPLSHLGLPSNVDAAMQWVGDGLIYVFKRNNFFRFDEYQAYDGIARYSHRRIKNSWDTVPNDLDAAMQWFDGMTYFIKGMDIYKYKYESNEVGSSYPKNLRKYLIKCPGSKAAPLKYKKRKKKGKKDRSSTRALD